MTRWTSVCPAVCARGVAIRRPHTLRAWLLLALVFGLGCEDDEVDFGLPGGLRARREGNTGNAECPVAPDADGSVCPDWSTEIYPLFDALDGSYGCALASCHGTVPGGSGLHIPADDPDIAYENMAAFENAGRAYIGPEDSYILCNLSPDPDLKIGSLMPLVGGPVTSLVEGEDLTALSNWVLCGSPKTGTGN